MLIVRVMSCTPIEQCVRARKQNSGMAGNFAPTLRIRNATTHTHTYSNDEHYLDLIVQWCVAGMR